MSDRSPIAESASAALIAVALVACPSDDVAFNGPTGRDGGADAVDPPADPAIELGRADRDGTDFRPYGEAPELDLVHGNQGGWHVWPHVRLTGVPWPKDAIKTQFEAAIFDRSTGAEITKKTKYTVRHFAWKATGDAYVHRMFPIIFDITGPDQVVGREVRVEVDLTLSGDGTASSSVEATIVDPDGE